MSLLSDFEDRVGNAVEGMFAGVFRSPVQPAELAKTLAKRMDRERSVGVGKVYAPTLYTVLISPADEEKLGAFAETLSGELATYLVGYARERGYELPSRPLVRFLVDPKLKLGRFEAYAELASPEELARVAAEMHESLAAPHAAPQPAVPDRGFGESEPVIDPVPAASPAPVPVPAPSAPYDQDEPLDDELEFEPFVPSELPAPSVEAPPLTAVPAAAPLDSSAQVTTVLGVTPGGMATVTVTGVEHDVMLRGERVSVGRLAACDITLADANSSREHAAFVAIPGGWAVEDLGSTNGTWLNGAKLKERTPLADGDTVTVGVTELVYHGPEA